MSPTPAGAVFEQAGDQGGPAGLVACPQPAAGVPVEVLVEEDVVAPVRVTAGSVLAGADTIVEQGEVEPLDETPNRACRVVWLDEPIEWHGREDLLAISGAETRPPQ